MVHSSNGTALSVQMHKMNNILVYAVFSYFNQQCSNYNLRNKWLGHVIFLSERCHEKHSVETRVKWKLCLMEAIWALDEILARETIWKSSWWNLAVLTLTPAVFKSKRSKHIFQNHFFLGKSLEFRSWFLTFLILFLPFLELDLYN